MWTHYGGELSKSEMLTHASTRPTHWFISLAWRAWQRFCLVYHPCPLRRVVAALISQCFILTCADSRTSCIVLRSSHSCTLWLRYLHFKASHFASFSVPRQRSIYTHSIRALESKRESTTKGEEQELRAKGVFIMVSVAIVVVAQTTGCPPTILAMKQQSDFMNAVHFAVCLLFLAGAVACLVRAPQTDRSMLGDSKEKVGAERNLLDVLWSYCMMEEAAGCVL